MSRTLTAQWAARSGHTSVIDAAGAIYVIGGYSYSDSGYSFQDVWVSTDGGARPDSVRGWGGGTRWVLSAYSRGTTGYRWDT
jgi:hypothetical protein